MAEAVTPSTVSGYWAIGSDGKVYNFGDAQKMDEPTSPAIPLSVEALAVKRVGGGSTVLVRFRCRV